MLARCVLGKEKPSSLPFYFFTGAREVVILSERAARARAKDLLAVGLHERQVLRACRAQEANELLSAAN